MHRPVRRGVGHVEKHRLVRRLLRMLLQKCHRVVTDRVGVIVRLRLIHRIVHRCDELVTATQRRRIIKTARSNDRPVKFLEAPLQRPVILRPLRPCMLGHMPFAAHVPPITAGAQCLGNGHHIATQFAAIPWQLVIAGHQPNARLVLIHPRQQRRPRRAAARGVVKLREPQPLRRQLVQHRRFDLTAVTTDIGKTHIIGHNDHDVGLLGLGRRKWLGKSTHHHEEKKKIRHAASLPSQRTQVKPINFDWSQRDRAPRRSLVARWNLQ